jgi:predicted DNA-binding transcriptional regulator AlpA
MKRQEYSFTLILSGVSGLPDEVVDALYEAGCDDALVGTRDGVVFLDFDREADSLREAVLSAIADVERANIGARVVRVEPDEFVTMAEIARRTNRTRESIRLYSLGERGPGQFPSPMSITPKSPLWRWTDVALWFASNEIEIKAHLLPREAIDAGPIVAAINGVLDLRRHVADKKEAKKLFDKVLK